MIIGITSALILTGCSAAGGSGGKELEGVPYGATMEEYQAALESMEPIVITAQTPAAKGAGLSIAYENYFDAVTQWSDGKISFDVTYANGIAGSADAISAVGDGLLGFSVTLPRTDPARFPLMNEMIALTAQGTQDPIVGPLQLEGWGLELAASKPGMVEEFEAQNVYPLLPYFHGGLTIMLCSEPRRSLEALNGVQSTVNSETNAAQLTALKMTPVSIEFTELYESLQRGVVNCATTVFASAANGGLYEVAPQVTIDPDAPQASGGASLGVNLDTWKALPLPARQLMHDKLDVFLEAQHAMIFSDIAIAGEAVKAQVGAIQPFDEDARKVLQAKNASILKAASASADVDQASALVKKWFDILTKDLGYDSSLSYAKFTETPELSKTDVTPFVKKLFEEFFNKSRPE